MTSLTDAMKRLDAALRSDNERLATTDMAAIIAAARRVAEAPEVWWCEEHDISSYSEAGCVFSDSRALPCRMVRKLLVDP